MENATTVGHYEIDITQYISEFVCLGLLALAGLMIQPFIVAVHVIDWLKKRVKSDSEKIIASLGVSRLLLHIASLFYCFYAMYSRELKNSLIRFSIYIMSLTYFSDMMLSTLLSIFFFFKISTLNEVFYLRLKAIVSRRVGYLIIASVIVSLGYPFIFVWSSENLSRTIISHINLLCKILPFLMAFIASSFLIFFLGLHMTRMSNSGSATSSTDAYSRILKFTVASVLVWALGFVLLIIDDYYLPLNPVWLPIITNSFSVIHSFLLIYVATKLRNHFSRIVHYGTQLLLNSKVSGPHSRGSMEVTAL